MLEYLCLHKDRAPSLKCCLLFFLSHPEFDTDCAVEAIKNGESYRKTATRCGVNYRMLYNRVKGLHGDTSGEQTKFSLEEEEE